MSGALWYRYDARGALILTVRVEPNAPRTEVAGLYGGALKLRVAAPAVDNKANARLIAFLAEVFQVPQREVRLKTGAQGRRKVVEIFGSRVAPETLLGAK
ncbi:DUF167 domain-containing protein [Thiobacter aerophilum]|uniref:UPF0235 protein V6E02_11690 n=1 Tax=Thiobacter aerophilum TaxID=3121275 RepID=A0ABV0EKE1_9BURK